ncbi:hypothetical protein [Aquamicrobium soli]|uniref:Uncharacterized protein n=1 Tax=Aquamicrobium soli TaxID=1811518 RepID=A0ABV7KBL3_9HYPH
MDEEGTVKTRCVNPECGELIAIGNDVTDEAMIVCPACQTAAGAAGILRAAAAVDSRKNKIRAAVRLAKKEMGLPKKVKIKI